MTDAPPLPPLPRRNPAGHKGTFGTVAVVGGRAHDGVQMVGGPALAAIAALRAGAGLARLALPAPILTLGLVIAPSATGVELPVDREQAIIPHEAALVIDRLTAECQCLAIGPGLGLGEGPRAASLRAVVQQDVPVVIDADALNNLAETPELQRDFHAHAILTPHPGEFRRLGAAIGLNDDPADEKSRRTGAERMAQRLGCVVVLKGAGTVVSDGHQTWVNDTGGPALATAGTGDVLTGVIAGLVAQFHRQPIPMGERTVTSEKLGGLSLFDCARLAVKAHGLAAERWQAESGASAGLLATDLADQIPPALESLRAR